jgi:hypothetical protein
MSAHSPTAAVRSQISSIVIRPARAGDTEAIARVRVDSWRETYRGMIPQAYLDAMKLEQSRALWEKCSPPAPPRSVFSLRNAARKSSAFQWDGMDLVEAGYGWRTLGALTASLPGPPPSGTILQ